jgi:nitrate/TMAO reductase-like tetraheme cytochrome c subunit
MRNILLAVVAAAGLVGCVGGIDSTMPANPPDQGVGGGTSGSAAQAARTSFETNVYPIISAQGRCVTCHSSSGPVGNITGFVAPAAANGYVTAVGYQALVGDWTPTGAPILTKIAAGHNGMSYTADEQTKITSWLNAELAARAGAGSGSGTPTEESPADATVRLTKEWSGCMTLDNFTKANMIAWGTMRANNSACETCHVDGEYGQIASNVAGPFFTTISTDKYYMAQYFSVDLSKGVAAAQVIINTRSFTGVGQDLPPHIEHPRFTLQGSTGLTALTAFYNSTMANKKAGTCGPSTLKN